MRNSVSLIAGILFFVFLGFGYAESFAAEKTGVEPSVVLRVKPGSHTFVCGSVERGKEIGATNISRRAVDIRATGTADWIRVEPGLQTQVPTGGTALFTASVDCSRIKPRSSSVGYVVLESMGRVSKVKILVKSKAGAVTPKQDSGSDKR